MSGRLAWERRLRKLCRQEPDPGDRVALRNREELREAERDERRYRYQQRRRKRT